MSFGINVDFRAGSGAGYPSIDEVRKHGISWARCTSLPDMEYWGEQYLLAGCRILAVVTGESEGYIMQNASAIQIGNEWGMGHDASWPPGDANAMVEQWMVARDNAWNVHGDWFPLVAPGIWCQRADLWAQVAWRLEGVTAAAVHCYPEYSGHTPEITRQHLWQYRAVRPDLPMLCTEWDGRWPNTLPYLRSIEAFCSEAPMRYAWLGGTGGHQLAGTAELGILALSA